MIKTLAIACTLFFSIQIEKLYSDLIISEFMANNDGNLLDEDNEPSDWIELSNTSNTPISLDGYFLTDDIDEPKKWKLPNRTIPPNSYIVFFASGKDRINNQSESHTNFSLSSNGEYLALTFDGSPISEFSQNYPDQYKNISYGFNDTQRVEGYFSEPTPGNKNSLVPVSNTHLTLPTIYSV